MTIQRAIEILEPTSLAEHTPDEWLTAHRMACQALALLQWKDARREKPEPGEYVLGVCSARLPGSGMVWLEDDMCVVEYSETLDEWTLVDDVDMDPVAVSHWMRLPELPEGVEE